MAKIQIWHNPRCSKSRQGLACLTDKDCDVQVFNYMTERIDAAELARIIRMSGQPLADFIRTNEPEYKELGLKEKNLTVDEFAELAAKHPRLLQRPIVIKGDRAVLARPVEKIDELL